MKKKLSKKTSPAKTTSTAVLAEVPTIGTLPPEPVAQITIKGLGILYFEDERANIGFIVHPRHPFKMTVNGILVDVGQNQTVTINSNHTGYGYVLDSNDNDFDFSHIINLSEIHGPQALLRANPPFFTTVVINKATFYTKSRSVFEAKLIPKTGVNMFDLDRVGKVGGANIYDEDFAIRIGGNEIPLLGPRPYKILLEYDCPRIEDNRVGDFELLYGALELSNCENKNTYDLLYDGKEPAFLTQYEAQFIAETAQAALSALKTFSDSKDFNDRNLTEDLITKIKEKASCEVACQMATMGRRIL